MGSPPFCLFLLELVQTVDANLHGIGKLTLSPSSLALTRRFIPARPACQYRAGQLPRSPTKT